MAKQLNVNLSFTANTGKAKQQLQDLQQSLDKLISSTNKKTTEFGLTKDLAQATSEVSKLKIMLESTTTPFGTLDLGKFSQSLKKSGLELKDYAETLQSLGPEGAKAFAKLAQSITTANVPLRQTNKLLDEFATTMKNTVRWQFSSSMLHGFMSSISSALGYAKDLDRSLNDIRIVTGYNIDQMSQFAIEANKAAKALSSTTTDYTNASLIYYQQGLGEEEIAKRTEVTLKMANAAGVSAQTVSDQMTAVWNNFDDGSKSLEYYADVMTALGAATASSTDEISAGLNKFAAVAETVGLSYEYATAALATVTATTRESADIVGTAFKTLFARIQGLNLGETLDDGTTLNKYSEALDKVGIDIKDAGGNMKDMNAILDEMGAKWDTLAKDQQIALAQTVAGVRQYTQLMALMDNWDYFEQNVKVAENSTGTLKKQADIYAESWEASSKRVKAAAEGIYDRLLDEQFFIGINKILEGTLSHVGNLIDGLGGLPGILSIISSLMLKAFGKDIAASMERMVYNIKLSSKTNREAILQIRKEANQQTRDMYSNSADSAINNPAKVDIITKQTQVQDQLIDKAFELEVAHKSLTEEEQKQAQLLLDQNQALGEQYEKIVKIKNESEIKDNKSIKNISTMTAKLDIKDKDDNKVDVRTRLGELKKLQTEYSMGITLLEKYKIASKDALSDKNGNPEKRITMLQKIKEHLQSVKENAEKTGNEFTELDSIFDSIDGVDDLEIALNILDEKLEELGSRSYTEFEEFRQAIQNAGGDMSKLNPELNAIWDSFTRTGELTEEQIQTFANFGVQITKTGTIIDGFKGRVYTTADTLVTVANVLTNFATIINSIKGLSDIWNDEDLTYGEKVLTTFTTLGTVIGTLVSTYSNFNKAKLMGIKNDILALAIQQKKNNADALGITLEKLENGELSLQIALKTILNALDLKKIAIYAALALAIGAVIAVGKLLYDQYHADAQGAKEAAEQAKVLTERYEELKNQVQELNDAIADYQDARNALDELEKGTDEYAAALENANKKAKELIETYGLWNNYEFKDGLITIDPNALEDAQNEIQQKANQAEAQMYHGEIYSNQADIRNETTQTIRNSAAFGTGTYSSRIEDNNGNLNQIENYRKLTENEVQIISSIATELKESLGGVNPTAEQLIKKLSDLGNNSGIGADALEHLNTIITENSISGFLNLGESMAEAEAANRYYAEQILGIKIEEDRGSSIKKMATDEDGNIDNVKYNQIITALTNKAVNLEDEKDNNIKESYEAVETEVKDISNEKQLNDFLNQYENNNAEVIKKVLGDNYDGQINNDKELGLLYAQMISGIDKSELTYVKGNGVGTVKDKDGNEIVNGVSDEVIRREIAKQVAMQSITDDYVNTVGDNEQDLDVLENAFSTLLEGTGKVVEEFGADFSGAILDAVANDNFESLDFSNLFSELDPAEMAKLSGLDSQGILDLLGIDEATLTALGYNVDSFTAAFSKALDEWVYTLNTTDIEQKAADLKEIADNAKVGDIIDQESYNKLNAAGINANKYFTQMEDGTFKLTGAAKEFQNIVENITVEDYINKIKEFDAAQEYALSKISEKYADITSQNILNTQVVGESTQLGAARAEYISSFEGDFNFTNEQKSLLTKNPDDYTPEDLQEIANMMDIVIDKSEELQGQLLSTADSLDELNNRVEQASIEGVSISYNAYSKALISLASSHENCTKEIERYQQALENGNKEEIFAAECILKSSIRIGEAAKKYDLVADSLEAQTKELMIANEWGEEYAETAAVMAIQNQRLNKGVKKLSENWKDWKKVLNGTDKTSQDYADVLVELSDAVEDLTGWYEDLNLDSEFVIENMSAIEKAAEGDMDAIISLSAEVAKFSISMAQLDTSISNSLMIDGSENAFTAYANSIGLATDAAMAFEAVQGGVQAGFDNIINNINALRNNKMTLAEAFGGEDGLRTWVEQLNAYAAATGMTAQEMQTMLSSVGVTANVQTDYQEQDITVPTYREEITDVHLKPVSGTRVAFSPLGNAVDVPYTEYVPEYTRASVPAEPLKTKGFVEVASISMDAPGEAPGASLPTFTGRQAPSTPPVSGGKGGGGSSKSSPAKPSKKKDVVQRYATVDKNLEGVREEADKLRASMNNLYGEELEAAMTRLIELGNEEKALLEEKRLLTEEYVKEDLEDLKKAAKDVNVEFTFDEENNIANYEEEMEELYEKLAAMEREAGDEWSESEQEQIDALKDKIATLQEAIDAYEETLGILDDINTAYDEMNGEMALPYVESDYLDIYYEVIDALDDIEEAITDAERKLESLVGQDRIDKLKEIEALEERRLELLKQQHEIAVADAQDRKDALDFMAMQNDVYFDYDKNGNISNYLEEMRKLEDTYAELYEQYSVGGITDEEQDALDALQANMDELTEYVDAYRDAIEKVEDIENDIQDATQGSVADPFVRSDYLDIYKETNDQLDDIQNKISKLERKADKLTGEERIKALQEIAELEREHLKILDQQAEIAKEDMEYRKGIMEEIAEKYKLIFEYDDNGNITNYIEQLDILINKYKEAYDEALSEDGLISKTEQEILDAIEQDINELENYIEAYCEAVEKMEDIENERSEISESGYVDMEQLDEIGDELHDINRDLDDLQEALDDSAAAADRLYGDARIKQMNKTAQLLDKEIRMLEEKKKLQNEIIANERQELSQMSGGVAQFDEKGNLTNYQTLIDLKKVEIQERKAELESDGDFTEAEAEEIQEMINELNKLVDQIDEYEQALEDVEDIQNEIDDAFYEWQDLNAEALEYKLELTLDVNQRELDKIERQLKRIGDNFYSRAEALALMVGTSGSSQINVYIDQLQDLEAQYNSVKAAYDAGQISHEAYVSQTKELQNEINSTTDAIVNLQAQMDSYYKDTLAAARQELAFYTAQMEHLTSILNHFKGILTALGKSQDHQMMDTVLRGQIKALENEVKVQKQAISAWQGEADKIYAKYQQELAAGNEENANMYYQAYQEALSAANDAENKYYAKSQQWAQALRSLMENTLSGLAQDLENALTGGTSMEELTNSLKRASSLQEEYLTTTNKIYETTKLMRNAQNEIDKTTNSVAKKRLASFIVETNQLQNKNKLSKYELSIQQAKYDLLMAEIALEEARFAKSTVRLKRDAEGNFGYVYTANAEAINSAEQKFEDAQNKLYNIGLEGANKYTEKYQQTLTEMYNTLTALQNKYLQGGFESEAEYNAAVTAAKEYYYDKLSQYSELYSVALTTDSRVVADAWSTDFADMTQKTEQWMSSVTSYLGEVRNAFAEWERESDRIANETVGSNLQSLQQNINGIVAESNNMVNTIIGSGGVLDSIMKECVEVGNLADQYAILNGTLDQTITKYDTLYEKMNQDIEDSTQAEMDKIEDFTEEDLHVHSYSKSVTSPTCTERGYTTYTCGCGDSYEADFVPALGHDFTEQVIAEATETSNTKVRKTCQRCGYYEDYEINGSKLEPPKDPPEKKPEEKPKDEPKDPPEEKPKEKPKDPPKEEPKEEPKTGYSDTTKRGVALAIWNGGHGWGNDPDRSKRLKERKFDAKEIQKLLNNTDPSGGWEKRYPGVGSDLSKYSYKNVEKLYGKFDTGGYTGAWGPEGKWAMLHEKEIILNKDDTKNFLASLELLDSILSTIDLHTMNSQFNGMFSSPYISNLGKEMLEQQVSIEANFPNVTDKQEIEDAFKNLVNLASQYANRK